jgi:hypothetical protein
MKIACHDLIFAPPPMSLPVVSLKLVVNLREAVGKKATNNLLRTVHHVPVVDDSCLFITFVPDGTHDQESRLTHRFENTE